MRVEVNLWRVLNYTIHGADIIVPPHRVITVVRIFTITAILVRLFFGCRFTHCVESRVWVDSFFSPSWAPRLLLCFRACHFASIDDFSAHNVWIRLAFFRWPFTMWPVSLFRCVPHFLQFFIKHWSILIFNSWTSDYFVPTPVALDFKCQNCFCWLPFTYFIQFVRMFECIYIFQSVPKR